MNKIIGPNGKEWPMENVLAHVGDGWHDLVRRMIDDLFVLGWDGTLFQIKEKFGGLRFYIGEGREAIHDRIADAERESNCTCDRCGAPGALRNGGWLVVRCDACHA